MTVGNLRFSGGGASTPTGGSIIRLNGFQNHWWIQGDPKPGTRPQGPNSFIFMKFSAKNMQCAYQDTEAFQLFQNSISLMIRQHADSVGSTESEASGALPPPPHPSYKNMLQKYGPRWGLDFIFLAPQGQFLDPPIADASKWKCNSFRFDVHRKNHWHGPGKNKCIL